MKLFDLISLVGADETIHIVKPDDSVYFGTVRNVYNELDSDTMKAATVNGIFTGFGGLCVEITGEGGRI